MDHIPLIMLGLRLGKCSTVRITVQFLLRVRIAEQVRTSRSLVKQGSNESRECTKNQWITENLPHLRLPRCLEKGKEARTTAEGACSRISDPSHGTQFDTSAQWLWCVAARQLGSSFLGIAVSEMLRCAGGKEALDKNNGLYQKN